MRIRFEYELSKGGRRVTGEMNVSSWSEAMKILESRYPDWNYVIRIAYPNVQEERHVK